MLKSVQAGRGLAALAVCAFHLSIGLADSRYLGHKVLDYFTWRGNLGVDFFFVLSGFIIMFAHSKDLGHPGKWKQYIVKRFIRVYPIYWLYTIGYALLVLAGVGTVAKIPNNLIEWISSLSLIRLINFSPPLAPAWTLFHEIGFYLVFSALIINKKLGIALIGLWMIIISFVFEYATEDHRTAFNTYFSAYNLDFLIGIAAYFLWKRNKLFEGYLALIFGLIIFIITFSLEANQIIFIGFPLLYGLAFGGVLAGATIWESQQKNISIPLAVLIGNASYTIYLTHESLMGVFIKVFLKLNQFFYFPEKIIYLLILIFTIASACLLHKLVEIPLIRLCKSKLGLKI